MLYGDAVQQVCTGRLDCTCPECRVVETSPSDPVESRKTRYRILQERAYQLAREALEVSLELLDLEYELQSENGLT